MEKQLGAALVAGGSGGVGQEICRRLANEGFDVAVVYRGNEESALAVVRDVAALGRQGVAVKMDLEDAASVQSGVMDAVARLGGLNAAIYAAGPYIPMKWVSQVEPGEMQRMMAADAGACFNFLSAVLPEIRKTGGSFTALSTAAAQRHLKQDVLSSVPKAAVEAMIRAVAVEEGRFGVRANSVGVGFIEAGMFFELIERGDFSPEYVDAARKAVALRRMGSAEDIAEAVAFLAGPRGGYITGQALVVDGGLTL
ncbi:MAG: SDR family oxidoreductase [Sphingobium sp.]